MENRIEKIRAEERKYHEACYDNYKLFEAGSWLHKPVRTVMDNLSLMEDREYLSVLDLGCGVGRNSIPIAETLLKRNGKVVCVDLIESALGRLMSYSRQHSVDHYLEPILSDIGDYNIPIHEFDFIVAVSALEHVKSVEVLVDTLGRMTLGTKSDGINCIIMSTNIKENDALTGESLEPYMEINLSTDQAVQLLNKVYKGWEVLDTHEKPLEFLIERNGREILLRCDCLTFVAMKNGKGEQ
ncbi:class I SAM-dependent methyltransferase [Paenibacillus prosopidis]|uniref:Methyltransferase family protein n=1 Tax=Paenibacillus prosopidis TaxID=630520 RepID=A0A368W5I8_9BACL|nr:class I SAM-dependent methyltransferase [Paenibacillus prosopidis]RCW50364.1 methyltransferase family protein [Paenibacillus prosopidis]